MLAPPPWLRWLCHNGTFARLHHRHRRCLISDDKLRNNEVENDEGATLFVDTSFVTLSSFTTAIFLASELLNSTTGPWQLRARDAWCWSGYSLLATGGGRGGQGR